MNELVRNYLLNLGFIPNKCGYKYLFDIIIMALDNKEILPLKYVGYLEIAKKYNKKADTVEKDIQNAISSAWLKGDIKNLYNEFGETIDVNRGKPGNKQFILTAINTLKSY